MKKVLLVCVILLTGSTILFAAGGAKRKKPLPYDFGSVTISNYSQAAGMAPVVFDHWVHRKSYTCRVCHVDIGFKKPGFDKSGNKFISQIQQIVSLDFGD